jgi:protein SCO1/2
MMNRHNFVGIGAALALGALGTVAAAGYAEHSGALPAISVSHGMHGMNMAEHAHHMAMLNNRRVTRSEHSYPAPDLDLTDMHGNRVGLADMLKEDRPILLNFIYTTCPTICPVLSATFAQVQQDLGDEVSGVRMISITIDPEKDTPSQLRDYAKRYHAGPQWEFYTGRLQDIVKLEKAFDIYRGSKVNHEPVTYLRGAGTDTWVRLDGVASATDIVREYRQLAAKTD